jgi:O-antigen/teichoic acid export membrane protein
MIARMACSFRDVRRQTAWLLATALSVATGIVLIALRHPGPPVRALVVAVPIICGLAYMRQMVRDVRQLDELQLRIHLEAAAIACLGVFVAANIYPVMQIAGFVGPLQPYYVVFLLVGLVLVGYVNAIRRYR